MWRTTACQTLSKALDISSATARVAPNLLKALSNSIRYNCDICLSEIHLNFDISFDNENLDIPGYILVWCDYASNNKQGCVCVYFKSSLFIQIQSISVFQGCSYQLWDSN